jgi:hypothetical protein
MAAILAREPEGKPKSLPPESFVDEGLHGFRRSSATTASTWLVWGNISKVVADRTA